jgi:hypothetical protein
MASGSRPTSQFAIVFADLMMGAMAVLIVMIVFLSIVDIKGQGESQALETIKLPPGLLDEGADPLVRIRLAGCGQFSLASGVRPLRIDNFGSLPTVEIFGELISEKPDKRCFLQRFEFEKGLNRRVIHVSANTPLELNTLSMTLTVGGWSLGPKNLNLKSARETDSPIVVVSLSHPKVIIEP